MKTALQVSLLPVLGFLGAAVALFKLTGLSKLSSQVRLRGAVIFCGGGLYWTNFRLSDKIFKSIP